MATISQSNPHHRKIELQSPLDLNYLQNNLSTSARQKLDLHFPPSALRSKPATSIPLGGLSAPQPSITTTTAADEEETDPLRQHVQSLLTTFLQRTWSAASQSITINGLDAHTLPQFTNPTSTTTTATPAQPDITASQQKDQEIEGIHYTLSPYDSRLQTRLATLYGELESLTAQVSKLRREAPGRGAEMLRESLGKEIEAEEVEFEGLSNDEKETQQNRDEEGAMGLGNVRGRREGWYEDVKSGYVDAVGQLARLSGHQVAVEGGNDAAAANSAVAGGTAGGGGLTGCVGKVQRARTVAEELE